MTLSAIAIVARCGFRCSCGSGYSLHGLPSQQEFVSLEGKDGVNMCVSVDSLVASAICGTLSNAVSDSQ